MKAATKDPRLIDDIGSVAGLYRTVFWMVGKRLRYGRDWEERLTDETMQLYMHEQGQVATRPEVRPS